MKAESGSFDESVKKFIGFYTCGKKGHQSTECFKNTNKSWCSNSKSTHTDKTCQKSKNKANKTYDVTVEHSYVFKKLMIIVSNYHAS